MTEQEQRLADDKMRAEIAKLGAETGKINKTLEAEVARIVAETAKINRERWYYPVTVVTAGIATGTIFSVGILKLLGII